MAFWDNLLQQGKRINLVGGSDKHQKPFDGQLTAYEVGTPTTWVWADNLSEQAVLDDFVSLFRIVPVSVNIAKAGGLYKRDYGKSHGVGLADAVLAATAEAENAELKTLNTKHYPMFKGLKPAYTK